MTAKTLACVVLFCDGCRAKVDWDFEPHFDDAQQAREQVADADYWWSVGEFDFCQPCRSNSHAYVPPVDDRDDLPCARCGLDSDDHEQMAQVQP